MAAYASRKCRLCGRVATHKDFAPEGCCRRRHGRVSHDLIIPCCQRHKPSREQRISVLLLVLHPSNSASHDRLPEHPACMQAGKQQCFDKDLLPDLEKQKGLQFLYHAVQQSMLAVKHATGNMISCNVTRRLMMAFSSWPAGESAFQPPWSSRPLSLCISACTCTSCSALGNRLYD